MPSDRSELLRLIADNGTIRQPPTPAGAGSSPSGALSPAPPPRRPGTVRERPQARPSRRCIAALPRDREGVRKPSRRPSLLSTERHTHLVPWLPGIQGGPAGGRLAPNRGSFDILCRTLGLAVDVARQASPKVLDSRGSHRPRPRVRRLQRHRVPMRASCALAGAPGGREPMVGWTGCPTSQRQVIRITMRLSL